MRDFLQLSGGWIGQSIQGTLRIQEAIELRMDGGMFSGLGSDKDGDFEIVGSYNARNNKVTITRRYTWCPSPNEDNIGVPYHYEGTWDGQLVDGFWHQRSMPENQGPFEMWPSEGEDSEAYSLADLKIESGQLTF
jgi:hypothetical protein